MEESMEYVFSYESSCMGHDNYPYYLRRGDEWPREGAYEFGETIDLIEILRDIINDCIDESLMFNYRAKKRNISNAIG